MQPGDNSIQQLSSLCDELLSTKAQRNQELQSISELLHGIKQFQDAQQGEAGKSVSQLHDGQLDSAAAGVQLQHLQQQLLLHTSPACSPRHVVGTTMMESMQGTQQQLAAAPGLLPAPATAAEHLINQLAHGISCVNDAQNAAGQGDRMAETSWPQAALLSLLEQASTSSGGEADALCGSSTSSCCSSAPGSPSSADMLIAAASTLEPLQCNAVQEQQQPQLTPKDYATSRFAFPAGGIADTQMYVTPLKIPHPSSRSRIHCISGSDDGGTSSSSGHGSYVASFHRRNSRPGSTLPPLNGVPGCLAAAASMSLARSASTVQAAVNANPQADLPIVGDHQFQQQHTTVNAISTVSSEAAALMLVLRSAAEQREAARGMLQARSCVAVTDMLTTSPSTSQERAQPTLLGGTAAGIDGSDGCDCSLADLSQVVSSPKETAVLGTGQQQSTQQQQQQKENAVPRHEAQQQRSRGANVGLSSTQPSADGPLRQLRRSNTNNSSSNNSVHKSQRVAAEQLLHDALESSSFSSLMALLDGQACSEDGEEVAMQAPTAAQDAHATVVTAEVAMVVAPAKGAEQALANTPSPAGFAGAESQPSTQANTADLPVANGAGRTAQQQQRYTFLQLPQAGRLLKEETWGSLASTPMAGECSSRSVGGFADAEGKSTSENITQPQGAQHEQQWPIEQQEWQQEHALHQQPTYHHHNHPQQLWHQPRQHYVQLSASSIVSGAASELEADALSIELEQLTQQVEQERQRLLDLQEQRQQLEQELAASQEKQQQQHQLSDTSSASEAAAGDVDTGDSKAATATIAADGKGAVEDHQPAACSATQARQLVCTMTDISTQTDAPSWAEAPPPDASCSASGVDVGCQALLLSTAGLPVVGPPPACRVCPAVQQQLLHLQDRLEKAQEQERQAQLASEQHRHQAMTAQSQLALARQKLRQATATAAKPLAMSGWEDLIEEAAADLERLEGHVSSAAQRLIELQAGAASAAEALTTAQREAQRRQAAAAAAALNTEELQQQAEGLIAAISNNEQSKATSTQQLSELQSQLQAQQAAVATATEQASALQSQVQQLQQQLATVDQQLAERERSKQQVAADVAEKQHALQVTRGECAAAQDRLSQVQQALVEARHQLEALQQQQVQQQRQQEETSRQLAALQAQKAAAAAEAASAQQQLQRVLHELEQCQQDVQASELQHAELEESAAAQQQLQQQHKQAADTAAAKRAELEAEVAAAQQHLERIKQQAQAAKDEANLCNRAAAVADRQLMQVQQTLAALQAGTTSGMQAAAARTAAGPVDQANAAAAVAASATAHLAECAQLQVKLAAAESRRQLAEERSEEAERKLQQLRTELSSLKDQHDAADRQLRQATGKIEKLKDKLKEKVDALTAAQEQLAGVQRQLEQARSQQQQQQVLLQSHTSATAAAETQKAKGRRNSSSSSSDDGTQPGEQQQHAGSKSSHQLLSSYQQRLQELEAEAASLRSQLKQAEQELQQQRQTNGTLQQQLTSAQHQLVQAQQQLLELPRQLAGAGQQQQQADHVQMAVRSSIHGLQELLQTQSKLQHAQLQADAAKQQVQELLQERKQLQKKLATYKQQLVETKAALERQFAMQQSTAAAAAAARASGEVTEAAKSAAAGNEAVVQQLQQQLSQVQAELAASHSQVTSSQQNLDWSKREAEHLQQMLCQQQEISNQLKAEVARLQRQSVAAPTFAASSAQDCRMTGGAVLLTDACVQTQVHGDAEQQLLQAVQAECVAAKQQLLQANMECTASQQQLQHLQQKLLNTEQQHKQQADEIVQLQEQLAHKENELTLKAQRLQSLQEQQRQQEAEQESKMQQSVHLISQELGQCKAELVAGKAVLQQLQQAASLVEQQLATALRNTPSQLSTSTVDSGGAQSVKQNMASHISTAAAAICGVGCSVTAEMECGAECQQQLAKVMDLARQLAAKYAAAQQAQSHQQQQLDSHSQQLQHVMEAFEKSEAQRQAAELLVFQLQKQCQLLQLKLQQSHNKQQHQDQLPGRMSMSSVLHMMEQLHSATVQQAPPSNIGSSTAAGLQELTVTQAAVPAGPGSSVYTPGSTPHMSLEMLGGLAPPASCLSPRIAVTHALQRTAVEGMSGEAKPGAARGLYGITQPNSNAPIAGDSAAAAVNGAGSELVQLRQRLIRLSQETLAHLPPGQQQLLQTQQHTPASAGALQSPTLATPVTARYQLSSSSGTPAGGSSAVSAATSRNSNAPEVTPSGGAGAHAQAAVNGAAQLGEASLQQTWEWLQQQATGHDKLMQHMRLMWSQASALAQHCMLLEAAVATEAQRCDQLRASYKQEAQQLEQQKQQQEQQQHGHTAHAHADGPCTGRDQHQILQGQKQQVQQHVGNTGQHATSTNALVAAAEPLIQLVHLLQQDVDTLASHNKKLLEAAKKLCSSFRSGGRLVRVRSLALKLELQQHGIPDSRTDSQEQDSSQAGARAVAAATEAVLPAVVAQSVVQHWNEVETLLAELHRSTEALLQLPLHQQRSPEPQIHGHASSVAGATGSDGNCSSTVWKRAARTCKKLMTGLQQLSKLSQQQERCEQVTARCTADMAAPPARHVAQQHDRQVSQGQNDVPPSITSGSTGGSTSSSSDGLGLLLAAVQDRLAAYASNDQAAQKDTECSSTGPQGKQQRQHVVGLKQHDNKILLGEHGNIVASTAEPCTQQGSRRSKTGYQQESRVAGAVQQQPCTSPKLQKALSSSEIDVTRSAALRRAERAALMEKLRLLQRCGQ